MENDPKKELTFRPAVLSDADILLDWRNDSETRAQSINTSEIKREDHIEWLEKTLKNPSRKILIASCGNEPIGTVRLDIESPYPELSWTIAPSARGKGFGTLMVKKATEYFNYPLKAKIKISNSGSVKIAEKAGFVKISEKNGLTEWLYKSN